LDNWNLKNMVELKNIYRVINYYAYLFDPLQHHGAFVLTETELINGFPSFYPMNLLDKAWGYGRDHYFSSSHNIQNQGQINFINNNQFLRRMDYEQELPNSLYNLKYILSSIFLMPVYYYNARNNYLCKRTSIKEMNKMGIRIRRDFNWISNFRDKWIISNFPIMKDIIFRLGFNFFSIGSLDLLNRRIEFYLRTHKETKSMLKYASEVIHRGRKISDYLMDSLVRHY